MRTPNLADIEDLIDQAEALIDAATIRHYDRQADETFVECRLCGAWEAHKTDCPLPALAAWLAS